MVQKSADHINFDITLLGYCDVVVAELCRRAGWSLDHKQVRPDATADVQAYGESNAHWTVRSQSSVSAGAEA